MLLRQRLFDVLRRVQYQYCSRNHQRQPMRGLPRPLQHLLQRWFLQNLRNSLQSRHPRPRHQLLPLRRPLVHLLHRRQQRLLHRLPRNLLPGQRRVRSRLLSRLPDLHQRHRLRRLLRRVRHSRRRHMFPMHQRSRLQDLHDLQRQHMHELLGRLLADCSERMHGLSGLLQDLHLFHLVHSSLQPHGLHSPLRLFDRQHYCGLRPWVLVLLDGCSRDVPDVHDWFLHDCQQLVQALHFCQQMRLLLLSRPCGLHLLHGRRLPPDRRHLHALRLSLLGLHRRKRHDVHLLHPRLCLRRGRQHLRTRV